MSSGVQQSTWSYPLPTHYYTIQVRNDKVDFKKCIRFAFLYVITKPIYKILYRWLIKCSYVDFKWKQKNLPVYDGSNFQKNQHIDFKFGRKGRSLSRLWVYYSAHADK